MNLRFEGQYIRFRVTSEELDELLNGEFLNEILSLPQSQQFSYKIGLTEEKTSIEYDNNSLILNLNRESAEEHQNNLPSREGITGNIPLDGQSLKYSFEVDVCKKR